MIFPSGKTYPWQVVDKLVLSSETLAHCASAFADWKKIKEVFQSGYSTLLGRAAASYRYSLRSQISIAPSQLFKWSRVVSTANRIFILTKVQSISEVLNLNCRPKPGYMKCLAQLEASWPELPLPDTYSENTKIIRILLEVKEKMLNSLKTRSALLHN